MMSSPSIDLDKILYHKYTKYWVGDEETEPNLL